MPYIIKEVVVSSTKRGDSIEFTTYYGGSLGVFTVMTPKIDDAKRFDYRHEARKVINERFANSKCTIIKIK